MDPIINLKNISKIYDMGQVKIHALKKINLKIYPQEFMAIVGPSGSGKSTLMHIMGLLDKPTKGHIYLKGKNINRLPGDDRASLRNKYIGFIFQQFNLLPKTTALDNVCLPLVYAGIKKEVREKKAKKVLEKVGLSKRLHHFPSQLSGGQQQRVAIARAIVTNPSLVLADEPTGNLDSKSGRKIMALLADLNKNGHTIVLVTHEPDIATATQRTIAIKDGKIISDKKNGA